MKAILFFLLLTTVFACHTPLIGTYWSFKSYGEIDRPTQVIGEGIARERAPHVQFTQVDGQGRVSASAGCNSMGGMYETIGTKLKIDSLVSTLMACDMALMKQEDTLAKALNQADNFEINGKRLRVFYNPNQALEFVADKNNP
jgi:hypothetical protein